MGIEMKKRSQYKDMMEGSCKSRGYNLHLNWLLPKRK